MFKILIKKKFKKFNKLKIKDPKPVAKNLRNKNQKKINTKLIN